VQRRQPVVGELDDEITRRFARSFVPSCYAAALIGNDVLITRLYAPATLAGTAAGLTFNLTALEIQKNAGAMGTVDLTIDFNEVAECDIADITITVT